MRQLVLNFCQMGISFIMVVLLGLIAVTCYVLLPHDLIPEEIFGILGLIDDFFTVIGFIIGVIMWFVKIYVHRPVQ